MVDLSSTADRNYTPSLFMVHQMLDEMIVGEEKTRMAIFTNWVLGCQNVNVTGQRASGKTHCVENVARFLPDKGGLYNLSRGSEKSSWYQADKMKAHSHIMIPELNKINSEARETLKEWGEGRTAVYRVTVNYAGNREIEEKKLPPRPFIFCLADEEEMKIDEQLRSRLTVVRMDVSEDQNKEVMQQKAELATLPHNPKGVDPTEYKRIKMHIGTLPPFNDKMYRHPAAAEFVGCIPSMYTDCRRDFPKYINNTYGICRFYWKERMSVPLAGHDKVYIVTPQDMYQNHIIYGETLIESSLRCSNMERQLIAILQTIETGQAMSRTQLQKEIRALGMNISANMIGSYMKTLQEQGYVEVLKLSSSHTAYVLGGLFRDFSFLVNWKQVLSKTAENIQKYYPTISNEYLSKYLMKPEVVHPFTGEVINLDEVEDLGVTTDKVDKSIKKVEELPQGLSAYEEVLQ